MIEDSSIPMIASTNSTITLANRVDHILARVGVKRNKRKKEPGLYALGNPDADSRVFVTANYSLSFDALRSSLAGMDAYILVLDTNGINVWCAAGKGTFGTDEIVHRIEATSLSTVVNHRRLILPQLGATGVAAHEVKKRSGFRVEYGPVRAKDLPEYLKTGKATPEMRRVRFSLFDRMLLIPVEVVGYILPMMILAIVFFFIGGFAASGAVAVAVLAGSALFPVLLPWLPAKEFSSKGFILGWIVMLPFAATEYIDLQAVAPWLGAGIALAYLLTMPPLTAFVTLNFTGATTFASKSGVKREMSRFIPIMALSFSTGIIVMIVLNITKIVGGF